MDIEAEFDKAPYMPFSEIVNKRSNCAEIHAFLLLNELVPTDRMIDCAEHDQIWLSVSVEELSKVITVEQILELDACGVSYDSNLDCLTMYR